MLGGAFGRSQGGQGARQVTAPALDRGHTGAKQLIQRIGCRGPQLIPAHHDGGHAMVTSGHLTQRLDPTDVSPSNYGEDI